MSTVLKDQAAAARLAIAESDRRSKNEAELAAIAAARNRAKTATELIAQAFSVRSTLADHAVVVPPLAAHRRKEAGDGRTGLRRAATQLTDPDRQLTGLLNGQSVQSALKQAEDLAKALTSSAQAAVEERRKALRPDGLDSPVPDIPGHASIVFKLRTAKARLEEAVIAVALSALPERLRRLEEAADTWRALRPILDAHIAALPPAIQRFFQAAATEAGAPWSLVTPEVRSWLDEPDRRDQYRVRLG